MISLPKWIQRLFAESTCPHCEKNKIKTFLKPEGVYAQGIREEQSKKTKKIRLSYFYECKCDVCGKVSRFSGFPTNMHDFIADMIEVSDSPFQDAITEQEGIKKTNKEIKEKTPIDGISNSEIEALKKLMEETKYFEDLLDKIGFTKEERDQLKKEYENK